MKAIKFEKISKIYSNGVHALEAIDLEIEQGDFFGLLGANGAGKSTTIGILSSLVRKTGGKAFILGHDIDSDLDTAKSLLGIVPQEINLAVFGNVLDIVVSQAGFYGVEHKVAMQSAEKYLRILQLWDKRNEITRNLSGGMKRRLMIARALVHEPEILVLDEPTAGVDIEIRHLIWQFLKELNDNGKTIILTSHYLEEVEHLCKSLAILSHGRVIKTGLVREITNQLDKEILEVQLLAPFPKNKLGNGISPLSNGETFAKHKTVKILNDNTIEITVTKADSLSDIITELNHQGIKIKSIRNKVNKLEEMFLQLIAGSEKN